MVVEEESRGDACTEYLESDRVILREMFCSADSIDGIPFIEISGLLDRILSTRGIPAKLKLLEELWLHFRSQNAFPVLRLLVPHLDLSRAAFGLKENGIARLYISALGLASNSKDALRLVNFRKPKSVPGTRNFATSAALAAGDFASVVYDVIRSRTRDSQDSKGWNIGQVNEILDQLAKVDCSSEERKKIWNKVVCEISAREQFWLVRIILKDLKIGLRHESLLKHFHPNAYEVFNSSTDLKQVCDYVLDPNSSKDFKGIQLFRPVRSMLAARIELEQIVPSFKGKKFCIEIKFDGERIQIHKLGNSLRFFTRSGKDFTERHNYRKVLQDAIFSSVQADGCIIDGELVVWNRNLQTFESFGMNRPVARAQSMQSGKLEIPSENTESQSDIEDSSVQDFAGKQLCFVAFDILMLDGKSLIEKTLQERKNILFSIIRPVTHVFELAEYYTEAKSTEDILKKLEEANENKLEGIVIKGLDSEYLPGEREKTGWIKLKAEYVEGMTDTVDAIIIGGYYGSGKIRSGDISRFLVAICEKPSSVNQFPTKFYPLCRVGSGYTIEQLREIRRILAPSWKNFDSATCQDLLGDWNPSKEDTPDLLISPSNSIILELMAGGISKVSRKKFNSGFTLRFPRVVSIRLSKPWYECDSLTGEF